LKVKGNTQVWPLAGPLDTTQLEEVDAVVVVVAVVVMVEVVVVVEVVEVVVVVVEVVVQVSVVQTASPRELQTQVLQSTVKEVPGVQGVEVEPPEVPPVTGQVEGQKPSEPGMCSPAAVMLVLHQGPLWSTVAHSVYTTPAYLKGN